MPRALLIDFGGTAVEERDYDQRAAIARIDAVGEVAAAHPTAHDARRGRGVVTADIFIRDMYLAVK